MRVRFDNGLRNLAKKLKLLNTKQRERFYKDCARELAARLLAAVTKKTPVGRKPQNVSKEVLNRYWKGYVGGTLRRGWTGGRKTSPTEYAQGLNVRHRGNRYSITVGNSVEYAPYVEYGHRQRPGRFVGAIGKRLKRSFARGQGMLEKGGQEVDRVAVRVLSKRLNRWLKELTE